MTPTAKKIPTAKKPPNPYPVWPRFGSVRLRFVHGTVRVVPVFGSYGSCGEGTSVEFQQKGTVPVSVSVPGKQFRRFRFFFRFLEKRFRRFRFSVLVRLLRRLAHISEKSLICLNFRDTLLCSPTKVLSHRYVSLKSSPMKAALISRTKWLKHIAAISEPNTPFFLWDSWRFGSVNAEIASDCDGAILVR